MNSKPPGDLVHPVVRARLRLRHLELFRHVCELQTIRKAAAAANMTQPAATKLMQELEDMFQVQLLQRNRRGMQLTPHGEILRRHIGVLMKDLGNLGEELERFTQGGGGTVRLGIMPSLSSTLLARSINALLLAHPGTRFALQEGTSDGLMQQLLRNELDISFGRMLHADPPRQLRVSKVYTESFDIVCSRQHPLAQQPAVKWKELASASWALPALGTPLREIAESLFTSQGILRPQVAVASSSFHQMRYVIAAGSLLGVLPHSIALTGQADGDLAILRPRQVAKFAPISLMLRGDIEPSPLVQAFEGTVLRTAKQLGLA